MPDEDCPEPDELRYLRLDQVLKLIPVSRSSWYAGQAQGKYPKAVSLGPRTRAYFWPTLKAYLTDPENWRGEHHD